MSLLALARLAMSEMVVDGGGNAARWFRRISAAADLSASGLQMIRYAIGTGAVQDSATTLPPGAVVVEADVDILVPYSPGTGIIVGSTLDTNLYQELADNTPGVSAFYPLPQNTTADPGVVRTTVSGAPVAGSGFVTVLYAVPRL